MKPLLIVLGAVFPLFVFAKTELASQIDEDYAYLESLYKHLHQNPELSFHEEKTAARLAGELRALNFSVTEKIGGHGVVAVMKNGKGPTVLLRADMDALPVQEKTGRPYASKVRTIDDLGNEVSVMHACGHDIHMTVFIGAARRLAAARDKWRGTLVMIAQPAEERGAGARMMLADGLFTRFPRPDYNLGLHVNASMPAGKLAYVEGFSMANVDMVDVTVYGVGGHGAYPHTTKDPVVLSAQIVNALQTLVSREIAPIEAGVVTVGSIHGGTKHNIIPDQVDLQLTVRSYSDETRNQLLQGIKRIVRGQALAMGLSEDKLPAVSVRDEYTPALYNNPELARHIVAVFKARFGEAEVKETQPVMGGEDFARYGRDEPKIPSFFFWLGGVPAEIYEQARKTGAGLPSLHSPFFWPAPEPTLKRGVEAMTAAALSLFGKRDIKQ